MTGFPRPERSFYLDDMEAPEGTLVRCKCSMGSRFFTPGWLYMVRSEGRIQDNTGTLVVPSARFTYP